MRELLEHLEAHGFQSAPRVLGFDELGREVLPVVEGLRRDLAYVEKHRQVLSAALA